MSGRRDEEERIDRRAAAIAAKQDGVIGRAQTFALGMTRGQVDARVAAGRWFVLHRGVYAVGHVHVGRRGRLFAAVLASGADAVVSHASAASDWAIRRSAASVVDVTVRGNRRRRAGIRLHRHGNLLDDEVTVLDGLPITTPARTLLDLAATRPRRTVERALDALVAQQLFDLAALEAVLAPPRPGCTLLRAVLAEHAPGSTATASGVEEAFLALCRAEPRVPEPDVAVPVGPYTADFLFPDHALVIEIDGPHHATRRGQRHDRRRDAWFARRGLRTHRFETDQVGDDPDEVVATLLAVLAACSASRLPEDVRRT
jgi:hypothetical protein